MTAIEKLIKQAESRKAGHEQARGYFLDGTMTAIFNGSRIPADVSVAKEDAYIAQEEELIAALKELELKFSE